VDLGTTANAPIRVNRRIVETDVCIGIGNIVRTTSPAGRRSKIVAPGISGKDTINAIHLLSVRCPSTNLGLVVIGAQ